MVSRRLAKLQAAGALLLGCLPWEQGNKLLVEPLGHCPEDVNIQRIVQSGRVAARIFGIECDMKCLVVACRLLGRASPSHSEMMNSALEIVVENMADRMDDADGRTVVWWQNRRNKRWAPSPLLPP